MSHATRCDSTYVVPTYRARTDPPWYHFLHGNVPGHQIDFIYRPELPQGALTQQHFSHLARLIKYIEPRPGAGFAFAVGNLSRDDTQHEPGHGGIALIFGLRVKGATDHAGRRDPPFAHGIAAVDREVDPALLLRSATSFYHHLLGEQGSEGSGALAGMYAKFAAGGPPSQLEALRAYIGSFGGLCGLRPGGLSMKWSIQGAPRHRRVVIVHQDDAPFEVVAGCAARIAAVLYRSDLRWTSITTGREGEIPNGVSIRLAPAQDRGGYDADSLVLPLEQVPESELQIATRLFALTSTESAHMARPLISMKIDLERPRKVAPEGDGLGGAKGAERRDGESSDGALKSADASAFLAGSAGGPACDAEHGNGERADQAALEPNSSLRQAGGTMERTYAKRGLLVGLLTGAAMLVIPIVWLTSGMRGSERGAGAADEPAAHAKLAANPLNDLQHLSINAGGQPEVVDATKRPSGGEQAAESELNAVVTGQGDGEGAAAGSPGAAGEGLNGSSVPGNQGMIPDRSPGRRVTRSPSKAMQDPLGGKEPLWTKRR